MIMKVNDLLRFENTELLCGEEQGTFATHNRWRRRRMGWKS